MPLRVVEVAAIIAQRPGEQPLDLRDGEPGALGDVGIAIGVESDRGEDVALYAGQFANSILDTRDPALT